MSSFFGLIINVYASIPPCFIKKEEEKEEEKRMAGKEPKTILRVAYTRPAHERRGYHRVDGTLVHAAHIPATHVPAARITARGRAAVTGHKGKKQIVMTDDKHLSAFGYHIKEAQDTRHRTLGKAVAHYKPLPVFRRLVALSTLLKNTEPALSKRARADAAFVHKMLETQKAKK